MKMLLLGLIFTVSIEGGAKPRMKDAAQLAVQPSVLFETHQAPTRFQKISEPPRDDHSITLQIGLKNTRLEDSIDDLLERMSDPSHPNFRPYLNDDEFAELIQPDIESLDAAVDWLKIHGFRSDQIKWSARKDWISLERVPLKKVEHMLNTTYSVYQNQGGERIIRTENYSLPKNLHGHIDLVHPTTMFGSLHKQRSRVRKISEVSEVNSQRFLDGTPDICLGPLLVTNACLRQLYKTEGYQVQVPDKNMIATTGYIGESANLEDAQLFLKTQRADQLGRSFDVVLVNGGGNPQDLNQQQVDNQLGIEANLDTQTALGLTLPTRNIFYSVGGSPPFIKDLGTPQNNNEPFLEWLQYMLAQPIEKIPKVISSSYGDEEQSVPLSYARRVCYGFAALSARGVSLIFSSGDFGVGESGTCYTNDGQRKKVFLPDFPASCPYVTTVGGTENFYPEVAASQFGLAGFASGGGFSNYFQSPEWQRTAVNRYLQFLGPEEFKGFYNQTGRAYPDVSAQGSRYAIAWRQSILSVDGTSASSPTFASIIALLNDYSLSLGGPSLGYLNPWLYTSAYSGLNDIIFGNARGCNTSGFRATEGWDPVTGLGTPDFRKLQDLIRPWSLAMAQGTRAFHAKFKGV